MGRCIAEEFQDALASSAPTPGGGSAAGVALGQAAALAVMVSDLTLGNENWRRLGHLRASEGYLHPNVGRRIETCNGRQ